MIKSVRMLAFMLAVGTFSFGAHAEDNPVVAKVNGLEIHMSDLTNILSSMPEQMQGAPMEQIFPMLQEQVVMGEIISAKARDQKLADDPEVQQRLATLKENVIRGVFIERAVKAKVTDASLQAEYKKFTSEFKPAEERHAQHILVDKEADAKSVIAQLDKGAKFEDLVKKYSKDKGAKADGDLGFFKKTDMVKEFSDAAFAMKKGTYSKTPVKTAFGYHVINMLDTRTSAPPTFEQLKGQLTAQAQQMAVQDVLKKLKDGAKIELFDMQGKPVKAEKEKK